MTPDTGHPIRKRIRLAPDSYKQRQAYFVTVCTHEKQCILSVVDGQSVNLTKYGEIVRSAWLDLPNRFAGLVLDEYIIMPNHLHGILCFVAEEGRARPALFGNQTSYGPFPAKRDARLQIHLHGRNESRLPHAGPSFMATELLRSRHPRRRRHAKSPALYHRKSSKMGVNTIPTAIRDDSEVIIQGRSVCRGRACPAPLRFQPLLSPLAIARPGGASSAPTNGCALTPSLAATPPICKTFRANRSRPAST
jgi:hypothetical protein